jgi:hypothetical protein
MLGSLSCFTSQFKPLLTADLERFFAEESARMLCDSEVSVFLLYCERRLKEEEHNLGAVMSASDCGDMIRTVQRVLLEVNIDAILSQGLATLVDASRFQGQTRHRYEMRASCQRHRRYLLNPYQTLLASTRCSAL